MSNHQALVEALSVMKSILDQELMDMKFHIFSGCSAHLRKVLQLQALSANDVVLTLHSDFFCRMMGITTTNLSTSMMAQRSAFEDGMALDDYGYASDSDLEDEEVKASQTPPSDLKGNIRESDDDDDLLVADARSEIDALTSPPQAAMPIIPIQHKPRVVNYRNILVQDTAFRT
ncbi:hypothetical protein F4604DRAFT_1936298 [Suillus subluteus]|nr:hypothetical protein F4604DRAFT_1936298 [Suillus subluteus]